MSRLPPIPDPLDCVLFDAELNSFGWGPMMPIRLMVLEGDLADARRVLAAP